MAGIAALMMLVMAGRAFAQNSTSNGAAGKPADVSAPAVSSQPVKLTPAELDAKLKNLLAHATLTGRWCMIRNGQLGTNQADKYTIQGIEKVSGESWMLHAHIQYGQRDVIAPIPVRIQWAGDTPVLVVDNLGIPGGGVVHRPRVISREHLFRHVEQRRPRRPFARHHHASEADRWLLINGMKTYRWSVISLHFISTLVALTCAVLVPQSGVSQDTGSVRANSSTNDPARLPVVTVVAQKEPQAAETLPVSVTAVTRQTLQDAGIQSVKDASVYAPNTFINQFTARALSNPFFRGIGGSPLNPGVTTFIDGVPQLNSYSSSVELLDVDQVEFVRGPQGALFGRNTAGGLINLTSRRPADLWTSDAEGSFGNYNYRDVRGTISGPITKDELGMGISAGYSARDGYTVNDFNGQNVDHREDAFGEGQLLYKANDRLEVRFIAFGEHDHDGDYALGDLNYIRANPNHVDYDFTGGFNHRDVASGTVLINYFGEGVDVSSISGGVWWKNEGLTDLDYQTATAANGFLFSTRDNVEEQHQFTQEFRFSSSKDRPVQLGNDLVLNWQSGVFLFTQSYDQRQHLHGPVPSHVRNRGVQADLDDWGAGIYGQTKLTAWDKLDFIAGLRYDYEGKSANLFYDTIGLSLNPAYVPQNNLSDHFGEVSPQFSLAYHLATNQMVYGTAARGYKAGGFNPIFPPGGAEYGTEHSWNYEIGYKAGWLEDKLETRLALFYIDWTGPCN